MMKIDKAVRLRGQILDAALVADEGRLVALFRDAKALRVSDGVLRYRGIGMVFNDVNMWPQKLEYNLKALKSEWLPKIRAGRKDALRGHSAVKLKQQPTPRMES